MVQAQFRGASLPPLCMHPLSRVLYDLPPSSHNAGQSDPVNSCRPAKLQDLYLHSCRFVPRSLQRPSSRIHPPTSFPVAPARDKKGPRAQVPMDPAPFSLTGLLHDGGLDSRRKPCAPSLLRPRLPSAPAPPRSPRRGGRAIVAREQRAARARRAGKPGFGLHGAAPPTRKNSPKPSSSGHVTTTQPPHRPAPPPRQALLPTRCPRPPACPLYGKATSRNVLLRAQMLVTLRGPSLSSVAAKTSLSRALLPSAPRPASALSLGPSLSIKPGAKLERRSFQGYI